MASAKLKSQRKTNNMNTDFAQNTLKLRRIMDKMPNATEAELRAEYIKQGGLLNKEETVERMFHKDVRLSDEVVTEIKKTAKKLTKEKVVKAVKKVTKKK